MKKEDIDFLKNLQNELLTQTNDGNADPVYWGIIEDVEVSTPEGCGDIIKIYHDGDLYSISDYKELLLAYDVYEEDEVEINNCNYADDLIEIAKEISDYHKYDYIVETRIEHRITTQTGCFLTKRACKKHIEKNDYHYNNPRTYAMTAWRNPEFERLINIIKVLDFSKIEVEE